VPRILASPAYRQDGLLLILFDESDGSDASSCCGEPQFPNTPNNGGEYPGTGGGRVGAVALSPYIDPGTVDTTPYNHFSLLASIEDLFGLGRLGYAGQAGLTTFESDLFTCYRVGGESIKLAQVAEDAGGRRTLLVKLWRPGRVTVVIGRRRRSRAVAACQLLRLRLPRGHGIVRVIAGRSRRTISY
jgi:hypothetical protein